MSDKETQRDELMALESIYNKEEFQMIEENDELGGNFFAFVKLPLDFKVTFRDLRDRESVAQTITVQFLPPICLHFMLPKDYPSVSPPVYKLKCRWLNIWQMAAATTPKPPTPLDLTVVATELKMGVKARETCPQYRYLQLLCKKLESLWLEYKGSEILYVWIQFLVEESFSLLKIKDTLDISKLETRHLKQKEWDPENKFESKRGTSQVQQQEKKRLPLKESSIHVKNYSRYPPRNRYQTERQKFQTFKEKQYSEKDHPHPSERSESGTEADAEKKVLKNYEHRQDEGQRTCHRERLCYPKNGTKSQKPGRGSCPWSFTDVKYSVMQLIKDYDAAQQHNAFLRNMHSCDICFEDKIGTDCTKFKECGHVFCKACIADYFTIRIKDGTVHTILCPGDKCNSQATPMQIQELVTPELYARYDSMLLNSLLDTLEDTYYCPRQFCQYPVAVEEGEKMAICPSCNYVFCVYCKRVYHGVEPCRFKDNEKQRLVEEYTSSDDSKRKFLEQRYGKQQLQTLVDTTLSEKWLSSNSKNCPNCKAAIEKLDGCNKMLCWKCSTSFCWLCEKALNPRAPYEHFSDAKSKCFNLLFQGVAEVDDYDDGWDEWVNEPEFSDSEDEEYIYVDDDSDEDS